MYVPILFGKQGELKALSELDNDTRKGLTPLIVLPPIPPRWVDGESEPEPRKSIDAHVSGLAETIMKSWGSTAPVFLDGAAIEQEDFLESGDDPFAGVLNEARAISLGVVPVIGLDREADYMQSAKDHAKQSGLGACLRLRLDDLSDLATLDARINSTLEEVALAIADIDLILDYGVLTEATEPLMRSSVPLHLKAIPNINNWRSVTVAASSFPKDLSQVRQDSISEHPRTEWMLWTWLYARRATLPRMPQFGDYAVQHPEPSELDPRLIRMSPNVRYTGELIWLLAKGTAYRRKKDKQQSVPANVQYPRLCNMIMQHREWKGASFSWGDGYIAACANGTDGPGSPTTWRAVGTNHHLTLVVDQLASTPVP